MYKTYIIKSLAKERYYIGHTKDLSRRLDEHNSGKTKSTKPYVPWELVYHESFNTKNDAYAREIKIKSYKGGRAFKSLLE